MKRVISGILALAAFSAPWKAALADGSALKELADSARTEMPAVPALKEAAVAAAQPTGDLDKLPGATAFEKLKALWGQGMLPGKEDLAGCNFGRVFSDQKPNASDGFALAGKEIVNVPGGGPGFAETTLRIEAAVTNNEEDCTPLLPTANSYHYEHDGRSGHFGFYLDISAPQPVFAKDGDSINFTKQHVQGAGMTDGGEDTGYLYPATQTETRFSVRKAGNYLVVRIVTQQWHPATWSGGWPPYDGRSAVKAQEAYAYLYKHVSLQDASSHDNAAPRPGYSGPRRTRQ